MAQKELTRPRLSILRLLGLRCAYGALSLQDKIFVYRELEACYWAGDISWESLSHAKELLGTFNSHAYLFKERDLVLNQALAKRHSLVVSRYRLGEVIGSFDLGIMFSAVDTHDGSDCTICWLLPNLVKSLPDLNSLQNTINEYQSIQHSQILSINAVFKTTEGVFLLLPKVKPLIPLNVWLRKAHPYGMPAPKAKALLSAIEPLMTFLKDYPVLSAALHPGHIYIDPNTFRLCTFPFAVKALFEVPDARIRIPIGGIQSKRYYPEGLGFADQTILAQQVYQVGCIAYELLTGRPPAYGKKSSHIMHIVLKKSNLSRHHRQSLHHVLVRKKILKTTPQDLIRTLFQKSITAKKALLPAVCAAGLLGLFIYQPSVFAPLENLKGFVGVHNDRAIESLKADFLDAIHHADVKQAKVIWETLQSNLPTDDPFMQDIAPKQFAKAYMALSSTLYESDPLSAWVLVRAATRISPPIVAEHIAKNPDQVVDPFKYQHLQVDSSLQVQQKNTDSLAPTVVLDNIENLFNDRNTGVTPVPTPQLRTQITLAEMSVRDRDLGLPEIQLPPVEPPSCDILSPSGAENCQPQSISEDEPLIDLPDIKPIYVDACLDAWVYRAESLHPTCRDVPRTSTALSTFIMPKMLVVPPVANRQSPFAVSQLPISTHEYNVFCEETGHCTPSAKEQPLHTQDSSLPNIALDLADVEGAVNDYNAYCQLTNDCPLIETDHYQGALDLTYQDAQAYAAWLSEKTGYTYRLPTEHEHWYVVTAGGQTDCYRDENAWGVMTGTSFDWNDEQGDDTANLIAQMKSYECEKTWTVDVSKKDQNTRMGVRLLRELQPNG